MSSDDFPVGAKNYLIITTFIEEIKSSNKIEGINSTRKEEFLPIETSLDIRKLYDEMLLRDILDEDMNGNPDGVVFRKNTVEIRSSYNTIHKGIDGEKNIIKIMDKSLKILNDTKINFLIRIAIFHYLFEYIHPFYNENGRMDRFIVSDYLSKHLNILCALQFSVSYIHNYKKYYDAFKDTNDIRNKSDLTVFIIYFLEIYLSGLKKLKDHIENTLNMYNHMKKKINQYVNNKYENIIEILLQATLFGIEGMTMSELV